MKFSFYPCLHRLYIYVESSKKIKKILSKHCRTSRKQIVNWRFESFFSRRSQLRYPESALVDALPRVINSESSQIVFEGSYDTAVSDNNDVRCIIIFQYSAQGSDSSVLHIINIHKKAERNNSFFEKICYSKNFCRYPQKI